VAADVAVADFPDSPVRIAEVVCCRIGDLKYGVLDHYGAEGL